MFFLKFAVFALLIAASHLAYGAKLRYAKYLHQVSGPLEVTICEKHQKTLTCGDDAIEIIKATYGRSDGKTCSNGVPFCSTMNTKCRSRSALPTTAALCNGRRKCILEASDRFYKDPCHGTTKYLTVKYKCNPILQHRVFCEGSDAKFSCGNRRIKFHSANYGRLDSTTCSRGHSPCETFNKNCRASNTLHYLKSSCKGHSSCKVLVANTSFSEPCQGTAKYLEASYYCV